MADPKRGAAKKGPKRKRPPAKSDPPPPVPVPCDLCQICVQGTKLGFVMCGADGGVFVANDYPATGGPWAPAIDPVTGNRTWYNTGAP